MATSLQTNRPFTIQQETFCQNFVLKEEFLGNGTRAYADAYNIPQVGNWWKTCAAGASRLLKSPKISARINEILKLVTNDAIVDNELGYVITQKADLNAKVSAIREYNKLKKRVNDLQINDIKVLVLPNVLLKKNDIPISIPESQPVAGEGSVRYAPVQSNTSRKKSRKDSASSTRNSRKGVQQGV